MHSAQYTTIYSMVYSPYMKRTRSELARHAATVRWARIGKRKRSEIMSKIAKNGANARWKGHKKVIHSSIPQGIDARHSRV